MTKTKKVEEVTLPLEVLEGLLAELKSLVVLAKVQNRAKAGKTKPPAHRKNTSALPIAARGSSALTLMSPLGALSNAICSTKKTKDI
jgi:hypothetical protein